MNPHSKQPSSSDKHAEKAVELFTVTQAEQKARRDGISDPEGQEAVRQAVARKVREVVRELEVQKTGPTINRRTE